MTDSGANKSIIGGVSYPPRLRLRGYDSSDVPGGVTQEEIRQGIPIPVADELLDKWSPENPRDVAIELTLEIGWDDDVGSDLFFTAIYTHDALTRMRKTRKRKIDTHRCIVVHEYDWPKIKKSILDILSKCERETYIDSIEQLKKYFRWEFE